MAQVTLKDLTAVAFLDPAGTKTGQAIKRTASRAAFICILYDWLTRIFVVHAHAARMPVTEMEERVFEVHRKWHTQVFGIEANGLQSLFGESLAQRARIAGTPIPIYPVIHPTRVEKDFRIRAAIRPTMAQGRLFIHPSLLELRAEISSFPMSPKKDLVDALASAISLVPPATVARVEDSEKASRLAYLRATGAHPSYIEAVATGRA